MDAVLERATSPAARRAVKQLVESRRAQEAAAHQVDLGMQHLAALGLTQRDIAVLAGVSQAEVSRRLKRRGLSPDVERLQRIILERSDGKLSSDELVTALTRAVRPGRRPGRASAYDGMATSSSSVRQLMQFYRSGEITRHEYDAIRHRLAESRARD